MFTIESKREDTDKWYRHPKKFLSIEKALEWIFDQWVYTSPAWFCRVNQIEWRFNRFDRTFLIRFCENGNPYIHTSPWEIELCSQ